MIGASELRRRGWTARMISEHLGPPDRVRWKGERGQRRQEGVYLPARVRDAERLESVQLATHAVRARARGGPSAKELRGLLGTLEVTVRRVHDVEGRALEAYRQRTGVHPGGHDRDFVERVTVNYIRHALTDFDSLSELSRARGELYSVLCARVYGAIALAYPQYAHECARQHAERQERLLGRAAD